MRGTTAPNMEHLNPAPDSIKFFYNSLFSTKVIVFCLAQPEMTEGTVWSGRRFKLFLKQRFFFEKNAQSSQKYSRMEIHVTQHLFSLQLML
jgi:hypothetical protein